MNNEVFNIQQETPRVATPPSGFTPVLEHSYGRKSPSQQLKMPRYPADIETPQLRNEKMRSRSYQIMQSTVKNQRKKIKILEQRLRRRKKRIHNLEEAMKEIRKNNMISEHASEQVMVSV